MMMGAPRRIHLHLPDHGLLTGDMAPLADRRSAASAPDSASICCSQSKSFFAGYGRTDSKRGSTSLPKFPAIAHVALTVSDLDRSRKWYQRLFGSDPVLDQDTGPFHQVVWSVSGALVAINGFPDLHSSEPFDERRPGLDHLAFACSSRSELEAWERRLNELDIPNGGVVDASYGSVLSFRDPDNIALELFASLG
ncbi:MAG TPA: VOC family protein [Candidatus Dormibacteraeota bacterium]